MSEELIYLDNHSTTRCDPRVLEAMLPLFSENYGNPHSSSHAAGHIAAKAVSDSIELIADRLGTSGSELVMTSGATESNNLAILGHCLNPRNKRRHVITLATEHPAVLDPMCMLEKEGFAVTRLPVLSTGCVDIDHYSNALNDDCALVSVMLANNEIGVLQPLDEITKLAHEKGIPVHTDATQAVGRIPIDLSQLGVDLLSASAHKFYGPKGAGLLFVRRRGRLARIKPLMEGGGQQRRMRPGTMNPSAIVGMAQALQLSCDSMPSEGQRIRALRDRMYADLSKQIPELQVNGPDLEGSLRLPGNLNLLFQDVEGESLMISCPQLAVSSGSACSSVDPTPSHVLMGIGRSEAEARQSLRIGIGRFNTSDEVDTAVSMLVSAYQRLKQMK